jgi:hypothetical protein
MMSHSEDFKDSTSLVHFFAILVALVGAPLLPMVMGWYTLLL